MGSALFTIHRQCMPAHKFTCFICTSSIDVYKYISNLFQVQVQLIPNWYIVALKSNSCNYTKNMEVTYDHQTHYEEVECAFAMNFSNFYQVSKSSNCT